MKKKITYISVAAFIILGGMLFYGCKFHHSPEDRAERLIRYLSDELDLTKGQQEKLESFKNEMLERRKESQECHKESKAIFMDELKKDSIDQDRFLGMYNNHKPKMDETVKFIISNFADFHESLTAEQKTKLIEKIESFEKWHSYFAD